MLEVDFFIYGVESVCDDGFYWEGGHFKYIEIFFGEAKIIGNWNIFIGTLKSNNSIQITTYISTRIIFLFILHTFNNQLLQQPTNIFIFHVKLQHQLLLLIYQINCTIRRFLLLCLQLLLLPLLLLLLLIQYTLNIILCQIGSLWLNLRITLGILFNIIEILSITISIIKTLSIIIVTTRMGYLSISQKKVWLRFRITLMLKLMLLLLLFDVLFCLLELVLVVFENLFLEVFEIVILVCWVVFG